MSNFLNVFLKKQPESFIKKKCAKIPCNEIQFPGSRTPIRLDILHLWSKQLYLYFDSKILPGHKNLAPYKS